MLRDCLVSFGGTAYANQVTKARLVPDTPIQQLRTLVPDGTVTDVDSTQWSLELSGIQDWETGGFAAYCNTNNGALVTAIIAPKVGSGKRQATVSVRIVPVDFGGDQGAFATFDATFPVNGTPTFANQA